MVTITSFRRFILAACGCLVLVYALFVLLYIQFVPDLGLRTVFGTELRIPPASFETVTDSFAQKDKILKIGGLSIRWWGDALNAPLRISRDLFSRLETGATDLPEGVEIWKRTRDKLQPVSAKEFKPDEENTFWVRLELEHATGSTYYAWARLGQLPFRELIPSVLWFLLKASLLLIGAWVWWKKPDQPAAEQFYIMCLVTVGAYIGGYHWTHLVTQPTLLLVFMTCAVLLPVVSLHFYLIFPRPKAFLQNAPRRTLALIYGIPLTFLVWIIGLYARIRWMTAANEEHDALLELLKHSIFVYFGIASTWYMGSIGALIHSSFTVPDAMERNQVRSILLGALVASVPIGYSLYLALWDQSTFSAGGATWPMFTASAILTLAYAVSITRYRLMELEKLVMSGVDYFVVSLLAAVLYYVVVFVGMLLFRRYTAGPQFTEALTFSGTTLVLLLLLDQARWRAKKFLDRRYSKQKSQLDLTLQRMGKAVEKLADPPALAQKFLQSTTDFLGIERGSVYLRQGEPAIYRLAGCQGSPPPLGELPPGSPLIDALLKGNVVLGRPRPYQLLTLAQKQLQHLGGEIAHPVMHEDRMLAFIVLGPKETPYKEEDSNLLAALAQITAMALESAEGHRTIEQLNHELREKVQKNTEQQRRILALQSQLHRQVVERPAPKPEHAHDAAALPVGSDVPAGIVGSSLAMQQLLGLVRKVAATDAVVFIRGESGTGKELLARAVHDTSPRAGKAFVKVHCAALSPSLLESELFGHVKGAFTGAHKDKVGRFEMANGGTLFLDEIGDITLDVQTKLLRVLQEKTFERVGSSEPIQVNVRIITATHQDLENLIRVGRFREDLYYRLNVFPVYVPPLRQRVEDIAELAQFFMKQSALRCKKDLIAIEDDVLAVFKSFPWPGNIRQLENIIERAVVIAEGNAITLQELPAEIFQGDMLEPSFHGNGNSNGHGEEEDNGARSLSPMRRERMRMLREELVRALATARGNKAEAARALGIARSTLVSQLKKFGLV